MQLKCALDFLVLQFVKTTLLHLRGIQGNCIALFGQLGVMIIPYLCFSGHDHESNPFPKFWIPPCPPTPTTPIALALALALA